MGDLIITLLTLKRYDGWVHDTSRKIPPVVCLNSVFIYFETEAVAIRDTCCLNSVDNKEVDSDGNLTNLRERGESPFCLGL